MKLKSAKEQLATLLTTLGEQYKLMNKPEGSIPKIELDIFIKNIQVFYESTMTLKRENDQAIEFQKPSALNFTEQELANKNTEAKPFSEKHIEFEDIVPQQTIEDKNKEEVKKSEIKKERIQVYDTEIPKHIESSFDDILLEPTVEAGLFANVNASQEILDLNKKLAEARGNHSLAEKLQNQQIESLKSVIGINDKFYFINELFEGNNHKYEDVIYTLNNFKKLDDAMQYFSTLKYRFNWNEDSEAAEKLVHMLERKFDIINA